MGPPHHKDSEIRQFFSFRKRFSENLLLWLHVEAECSLGLALLVGDDQRVLPGVPGGALHHVKADLSVAMVNVVLRKCW